MLAEEAGCLRCVVDAAEANEGEDGPQDAPGCLGGVVGLFAGRAEVADGTATKDAASWALGMVPVPSVAKMPMACRLWIPLVMAPRSAYSLETDGVSSGATVSAWATTPPKLTARAVEAARRDVDKERIVCLSNGDGETPKHRIKLMCWRVQNWGGKRSRNVACKVTPAVTKPTVIR
ncbi:hypothetical protein HMPREF3044_05500 [Corynebacterium sp. HMSC073D01]|nr:hypothetical protein HMPREF3044_05500 [Corynebacterium sp. HMSC073D01]